MDENQKPIEQDDINTTSMSNPPQQKSGLHTYAGDMAQTLRDQKGSLIKIAIAEQHKREEQQDDLSYSSPKNKFYLIVGILLAGIAIVAIVFIFISKNTTVSPVQTNIAPSLIFADTQKEIDTTALTLDKVFLSASGEVSSQNIKLNTIQQLYFTTEVSGNKTILSSQDLLKLINSSASPRLLRSMVSIFMFGTHTYSGNQSFMLFTTTTREDAFAGMLTWENKLFDDVYQLFGINITDKGY